MSRPKLWIPTVAEIRYLKLHHHNTTPAQLAVDMSQRFIREIREGSIRYQLKLLKLSEFVRVEPVKRPPGLYNEVLCRRWG